MDMPPTRFRVIERGRRLEVIDTRAASGSVVSALGRDDGRERPRATGWLRQTRFDGSADWRTHRLYDAKGPRTIALDPGRAVIARVVPAGIVALVLVLGLVIAFSPWVLAGLFALANPKVRGNVRDATTRMIDRLDSGAL